jgi:hypothetical protein
MKNLVLKFPSANYVDPVELGHFLFLFRGAYAIYTEQSNLPTKDYAADCEFEKKLREKIKSLNASEIDNLFTNSLGKDALRVQKISFQSPLEIALAGVPLLLCVAVILSGGKFKWGNLNVTLPPIGVGIKNLREALSPTIKAPLEYGLRQPKIKLSRDEFNELKKQDPKSKGKGGFQGLLVRLQQKVNQSTLEIELSETDIDRIIRYGRDPKKGGWQSRVQKIFGRHFNF